MNIKLLGLKLRNFKGIKKIDINFDGLNTLIFGDNAVGKTTIVDAFCWLISDKDSKNQSNFEIKTLNKNNQPTHNLEHEVSCEVSIDGKPLSLRKVFYEKWTKKRGSAKETFSGHTTDYYINDVPVKKSEYDAKIKEIIDEKIFKMLTSPSYFNEKLHWEERRKILLEVGGDVSDEEVIKSDNSLANLADILGERSIEEHRKVIKSKQKKINEELKKIPVRIDEVTKGLPNISEIDVEQIKTEIETLKIQKKSKDEELLHIENGRGVDDKKHKLAELRSQMTDFEVKHMTQYQEEINRKQTELYQAKEDYIDLKDKTNLKVHDFKINEELQEKLEGQMQDLRSEWYQKNEMKFEFEQEDICPTCGQTIPAHKLEESRQKALEKFNLDKAETLEIIHQKGVEMKNQMEWVQVKLAELKEEIEASGNDLEIKEAQGKELKIAIEKLEEMAKAFENSPEYKQKMIEFENIKKSIADCQNDNLQEVTTVKNVISEIENAIYNNEKQLTSIDQHTKGQERIKELSAQEKQLAAEYEKLESELFLTEEFTRKKVSLLEEKINSKFKLAKFKLFEEQVNGGLHECCETLFKGVPYGTNLNTGARINVGLDIMNTLSEHYNFWAPIFIDNREAVTELIEMNSQLISLIVSQKDKKLRIETDARSMKKAV